MSDFFGVWEAGTFRNILLVIFGLFTIYGAVSSVVMMRKMRARRDYKGILFEWAEPPTLGFGLSGLRYESGAWVAIVLHGLAVAAAGSAVCLVLFVRPLRPLLSWGMAGLLVVPVMVMMVSMAGNWWGTVLAHPLAERLGGERHAAVSPDGILYLGQLFPWNAFKGFSLAAEGTAIRLWSASFPGLIGLVLVPPSEQRPALLELLRRQLPGEPAEASGGFRAQLAFPALMGIVCGPLVLAAWLMVLAPAELALLIDGLLMLLLMLVGGPGLLWIGFRGKMRPAPLEESAASGPAAPGSNQDGKPGPNTAGSG